MRQCTLLRSIRSIRPIRPIRSVLSVLLVICSAALAGEAIYLQSGEEYVGSVQAIAQGQLHALINGQPQTFPLDQVHRIEFQRRRQHDDVAKAADLAARGPLFAEALKPSTDDLLRRFPQAGYVVLADETVVTIVAQPPSAVKGTAALGCEWEIKRVEAWRILADRGADSAMRSLAYFPDREQAEVLFGLTVAPDGTVGHLADTAMKDEALHSRLPAYNFQHRLRFTLKGAVPGATLFLATAHRGRGGPMWPPSSGAHAGAPLQPLVLDQVFWEEEPALRRSVKLVVEEAAKGLVSTATANGPKDWGKDGVWEVKDAPQLFHEPMMAPVESFAPRLVIAYPKAEWADVATAFAEKAGGAASLPTKGVPPRALFDQVRQSVRLERVPLDELPNGPAAPAATLNRGYGTEIERALLLAALLRGAGHKADVVLARRREDGPLLPAAPRLHGLSEALVRLTADGKETWLQADDQDRGFGELNPEVQGGEGLDMAWGSHSRGRLCYTILPGPEHPGGEDAVEEGLDQAGAEEVLALVALEREAQGAFERLAHRGECGQIAGLLDAGFGVARVGREEPGKGLRGGQGRLVQHHAAQVLREALGVRLRHLARVSGRGPEGGFALGEAIRLQLPRPALRVAAEQHEVPVVGHEHGAVLAPIAAHLRAVGCDPCVVADGFDLDDPARGQLVGDRSA